MIQILIYAGIALLVIAVISVIISSLYRKASPDVALIISGRGKEPRVISGSGTIVLPYVEQVDMLTLNTLKIDVTTNKDIQTRDFIDLHVDANVLVKIGGSTNANEFEEDVRRIHGEGGDSLVSEEELNTVRGITKDQAIRLASENFLNKSPEEIAELVVDTLEGNLREIVGQMPLRDIVTNRKELSDKVRINAVPDLQKMGLEIVAFNIQNFHNDSGLIEDLGAEHAEEIKKSARIAASRSNREVKIQEANDAEASNEARIASEQRIAEQNHELAIRKAELKELQNIKQAQEESAYEIEKQIRRKQAEQANAEAEKVKTEEEIKIRRNQSEATQHILADEELYKQQRKADAEAYTITQNALARKEASENEAESIRILAEAEAKAITDRNKAMDTYSEAELIQDLLKSYVQVAEHVVKPLENIDSITMYGTGNEAKLVEDTTNTLTQVNSGLNDSLGINITELMSSIVGTRLGIQTHENAKEDMDAVVEDVLAEDSKDKE